MTPEQKKALRRLRRFVQSTETGFSIDDLRTVLDALAASQPAPAVEFDASVTAFKDALKESRVFAVLEGMVLKLGSLVEGQPEPAAYEMLRQNRADDWAAFTAMRNDINEIIGDMPSSESTLALGPEMQHECAAVVEAVRKAFKSAPAAHPDDDAVDRFAAAMKVKLAEKRDEGRGGWDDPEECSIASLSYMLIQHVWKGDPVDVGNFAMMIHQRNSRIVIDDEARGIQPPADTGQAVAVKPLEWVHDGKNLWKAKVPWGEYDIAYNPSSRMGQWLWNSGVMEGWLPVDTFDIAKARAQADYEGRILSALTHPAPLDAERVREDYADKLYAGAQASNTVDYLKSQGAMLPYVRAALRQKEGKA